MFVGLTLKKLNCNYFIISGTGTRN